MSHLAVQVTEYLDRAGLTARQVEDNAGLPRMTIGNILNGSHPRPERLGQLLRVLDDTTAQRWLVAYLRDDCPPEYLPRLQILVADLDGNTLHDSPATYHADPSDHSPSTVTTAWQRLQTAIQSDTSLGRWFIQTVNLILGPE